MKYRRLNKSTKMPSAGLSELRWVPLVHIAPGHLPSAFTICATSSGMSPHHPREAVMVIFRALALKCAALNWPLVSHRGFLAQFCRHLWLYPAASLPSQFLLSSKHIVIRQVS